MKVVELCFALSRTGWTWMKFTSRDDENWFGLREHVHETPWNSYIWLGKPWFPEISCRFSLQPIYCHPLHDRSLTFGGNVQRIITSKSINGQRAFHNGVKFWETGSKSFIAPHHWRRRKVDNEPCLNKDLNWWNTISTCLKKLKRKFTLMMSPTSRKQTSLFYRSHQFSKVKKHHLPQNQPLRHIMQSYGLLPGPNLSEEESRCVAVVRCRRSADRCASGHCGLSRGFTNIHPLQ